MGMQPGKKLIFVSRPPLFLSRLLLSGFSMERAVAFPPGVARSCGEHSEANSRHGPPFATLRPPLSRAALESNRQSAVRTSGQLGRQQRNAFQHFSGDLLPPADVPEVCWLKATSSGTSGGDASCLRQGVPSGGLLAARQTPPGVSAKDQAPPYFRSVAPFASLTCATAC